MISLMENRAAVGLHNIYMKAKEYSSYVRGKFWFMLLVYILPGGNVMYLSTLTKVIR